MDFKRVVMVCAAVAVVGALAWFLVLKNRGEERVAYVSEQEQFLQSLQQEVEIEDPDALLMDLNESVGDVSENAEKARLNAVHGAPIVDPLTGEVVEPLAPDIKSGEVIQRAP
ncbi:MAG: hypothetical protein VXW65_02575 [Pseudomonadota bacterium]|nr:hypothetical protein [Pseudomonadota bacterium]